MVRARRRHFKAFPRAGGGGRGAYDRCINLPGNARSGAPSPWHAAARSGWSFQGVAAASAPGACQPPPSATISATAAAWRFDMSCDRVWRAESAVTCAVTTVV